MFDTKVLKDNIIRRIFGKVEIETIIKKIEGKRLKQTERNYLYRSIRPKLIAASILSREDILSKINKDNKGESYSIEYNLSHYGYDLLSIKIKKNKIRIILIEELIAEILTKFPRSRYIEAIPIIILKNKIDKFKMIEIATRYGIKNKIGYLLETAMLIRPSDYLKDLIFYFNLNKEEGMSLLVDGDYEFLLKESPKRIKKWNLLGRFFDKDFIKNGEAYL